MNKKSFGKCIKNHRISKQMTQKELADALYVDKTTVSAWERGKAYPDLEMVRQLCERLDISVEQALKEADELEAKAGKKIIASILAGVVVLFLLIFFNTRPPKHDFNKVGDMEMGLERQLDNDELVRMSSIIVRGCFLKEVESYEDPELDGQRFYVHRFKVKEAYKGQYLPKEGYVQFISPNEYPPVGLEVGEECVLCMDYYTDYNKIPVYGIVSNSQGVFYADGNWGFENKQREKFTSLESVLPKMPK